MKAQIRNQTAAVSAPVSTLTETAYRSIKHELLSGQVEPGAKLRIDPLCARLGVGASPIREALSRLVSEGFVIAEEQKGFRAAAMSVAEFREITELRILLETTAVRRAIEHGNEDWEAAIIAAYHRLTRAEERVKAGENVADWELRNRDFHNALVAACGSDWLMRLREMLYAHSQRYRLQSLLAGAQRRDTPKEHRKMRDAVLARDADKAAELIRQHFQMTLRDYEASAEEFAKRKISPESAKKPKGRRGS
jgi:DNA-binding GntR family transcriptional regulator